MLKILQARLQQYMNRELPDIQGGFRKGRGTRDQIATIHWITEKAREFQKNIYYCFIDYARAFDCVQFSSVQSLSHVWLFVTPWIAVHQASLSITNSRSSLNSCPLSWWCHPAISSSVVPFSSCPQSLPASESFPMSQLFTWGGPSTGVSATASVLPMNTQDWSPSEWTGWISLQSKGLSRVLQHHSSKASILWRSAFFTVQLSHPYMTTGKTIPLTRWTFVGKVMSLLFNKLSRLVITFLPRSKRLLISWL